MYYTITNLTLTKIKWKSFEYTIQMTLNEDQWFTNFYMSLNDILETKDDLNIKVN